MFLRRRLGRGLSPEKILLVLKISAFWLAIISFILLSAGKSVQNDAEASTEPAGVYNDAFIYEDGFVDDIGIAGESIGYVNNGGILEGNAQSMNVISNCFSLPQPVDGQFEKWLFADIDVGNLADTTSKTLEVQTCAGVTLTQIPDLAEGVNTIDLSSIAEPSLRFNLIVEHTEDPIDGNIVPTTLNYWRAVGQSDGAVQIEIVPSTTQVNSTENVTYTVSYSVNGANLENATLHFPFNNYDGFIGLNGLNAMTNDASLAEDAKVSYEIDCEYADEYRPVTFVSATDTQSGINPEEPPVGDKTGQVLYDLGALTDGTSDTISVTINIPKGYMDQDTVAGRAYLVFGPEPENSLGYDARLKEDAVSEPVTVNSEFDLETWWGDTPDINPGDVNIPIEHYFVNTHSLDGTINPSDYGDLTVSYDLNQGNYTPIYGGINIENFYCDCGYEIISQPRIGEPADEPVVVHFDRVKYPAQTDEMVNAITTFLLSVDEDFTENDFINAEATIVGVAPTEFSEQDKISDLTSIVGHVFQDWNGNGAQDSFEPSASTTQVRITNTLTGEEFSLFTDENGDYISRLLEEGEYSVEVIAPGYSFTTQNPQTFTHTMTQNTDAGADGLYTPTTINGRVFIDENNNGLQDNGEEGLAEVQVIVTDLGGAKNVITDQDGVFSTKVIPGDVTTDLNMEGPNIPVGSIISTNANGGTDTQSSSLSFGDTITDNPRGLHVVPVLEYTKTVSDDDENEVAANTIIPGQEFEYTLTVTNRGADAERLFLVDNYDQDKINIISNTLGGSDNGDEVIWYINSIAKNETKTYTIRAKAKTNFVAGTHQAENVINLTCLTNPLCQISSTQDTVTTTIDANPRISISKTVSDNNENNVESSTIYGDGSDWRRNMTYKITVQNSGAAILNNIIVVDDYDQDNVTIRNTNGGNNDGDKVTWTIPTLNVGESTTVVLDARLVSGIADGTVITNSANAVSDEVTDQEVDSATTTVISPKVSVSKTVSDSDEVDVELNNVEPGEEFTYTIKVDNIGNGTLYYGSVVDDYDQDKIEIISGPSGSNNNGDSLSWSTGTIAEGGSKTFTVTARAKTNLNQGVHSAVNNVTVNPTNYPSDSDNAQTNIEALPKMSIQKLVSDNDESDTQENSIEGHGEVNEREMTYKIIVQNTGTSRLNNIVVTDDYDQDRMTVIDLDGGATDGDKASWTIASLNPGQSQTINFRVRIFPGLQEGVVVTNQASAVSNEITTALSDSTQTTIKAPKVEVTKTISDSDETDVASNTVYPNEEFSYKIVVENTGDGKLSQADITDDYDQDKIEIISIPDGALNDGDTITWSVDELGSGERREFIIGARSKGEFAQGTYTAINHVLVTPAGYTQDENSVQTNIEAVTNLSISKTVSDDDEFDVDSNHIQGGKGEEARTLTYKLVVQNTGTADVSNAVISDDYDQDKFGQIKDISANGSDDGDKVVWNVAEIEAGQTIQLEFSAVVLPTLDDEVTISNSAQLDTDQSNPKDSNEVLTTVHIPILSIQKEVDKQNPNPGDDVTYTITVQNTGTGNAYNLEIIDQLPEELTALEDQISEGGQYDSDTNEIVWQNQDGYVLNGSYAPETGLDWEESSHTLTFVSTIKNVLPIGDNEIINTAILRRPGVEDLQAQTSFTVKAMPENEVKKYILNETAAEEGRNYSGSNSESDVGQDANTIQNNENDVHALPGDTLKYTIVYRNTGTSISPESQISNSLPRYIIDENGELVEIVNQESIFDLPVGSTIEEDGSNWKVTFAIGDVDVDEEYEEVTFKVTVNPEAKTYFSDVQDERVIGNNCTLTSNDQDYGQEIGETRDVALALVDELPTRIISHVFWDEDLNGRKDQDEEFLANIDVAVEDSEGSKSLVTDENGKFETLVKAGRVTISVDTTDNDLPKYAKITTGANGGTAVQIVDVEPFNTSTGKDVGFGGNTPFYDLVRTGGSKSFFTGLIGGVVVISIIGGIIYYRGRRVGVRVR